MTTPESSSLNIEAFASVSHELRAPLHAIVGLSELLLDRELSDENRELAEGIHREGEALRIIIDDLLDLSKINAGQMRLVVQPLAPRAVVDEVLSMFLPQAQTRGLALQTTVDERVPRSVRADRFRLRQVVVNLVSNAVKYTTSGGVQIHVDAPESDRLTFEVADTGPGIPDGALPGLFDPFQQARDRDRTQGTGLGLSICQRLIDLMGGTLTLDTSPAGTTFRIEIPVEPTATTPVQKRDLLSSGPHGRVLVVDDTQVNRLVAISQLERLGHHATAVSSGHEALQKLENEHFDVVLMDWHMPDLDGLDTAREYFERARSRKAEPIPLIMMTASVSAEARETCLKAGMSDFLPKPVNLDSLATCLSQWITGVPTEPAETSTDIDGVSQPASVDRLVIDRMISDLGSDAPVIAVIDAFIADSAVRRSDLTRGDNTELAARAAHTFKSTAALLGATGLSETCAEIESHYRNGEAAAAAAPAIVSLFEGQLDAAVTELRQIRDGLANASSSSDADQEPSTSETNEEIL